MALRCKRFFPLAPDGLLLAFAISAAALLGCDRGKHDPATDRQQQVEKLYSAYLNGDIGQARQCLDEILRLADKFESGHSGQAYLYFFAYGRLFALEKRVGNDVLAEAYLLKARYWRLRMDEDSGMSKDEAAARIKAFTATECLNSVSELDTKQSAGNKGPEYVQDLLHASSTHPATRPRQ